MGWLRRLLGGSSEDTGEVTPPAMASGEVAITICSNPACGLRMKLREEYEGKNGRCKKCGTLFLMTRGKGKLLSPSQGLADPVSVPALVAPATQINTTLTAENIIRAFPLLTMRAKMDATVMIKLEIQLGHLTKSHVKTLIRQELLRNPDLSETCFLTMEMALSI